MVVCVVSLFLPQQQIDEENNKDWSLSNIYKTSCTDDESTVPLQSSVVVENSII